MTATNITGPAVATPPGGGAFNRITLGVSGLYLALYIH